MTPGILSLLSIAAAILIGYVRRINTGIIAIALAFIVGRFAGGMEAAEIIAGWPLNLFFVLLGMTVLFSLANVNGTLRVVTCKARYLMGGRRSLIPVLFFIFSAFLAAIGPGNIVVCAVVLPLAMAVAEEEKMSPLLIVAMVVGGANAGGLSPIAPAGIITRELAAQAGLKTASLSWLVFFKQLVGQGILALVVYLSFRGFALQTDTSPIEAPPPLKPAQWLTVGVIGAVVVAIIFGGFNIGLTAFTGTAVLAIFNVADHKKTFHAIPWSPIVLVCGVAVLVNVCTKTGGIDDLTTFLARYMAEGTVAPIMAVTGGLMSMVSSASGVVLPTLIPATSRLAEEVGGDPTAIISAIALGSHVVTLSPFSTLGALAVASASDATDKERLFRRLLVLALLSLGSVPLMSWLGVI